MIEATIISLQSALVATLGMALPAYLVAGYLVRNTGRVAFVVDLLVAMPLALPPVAVGFRVCSGFSARLARSRSN